MREEVQGDACTGNGEKWLYFGYVLKIETIVSYGSNDR